MYKNYSNVAVDWFSFTIPLPNNEMSIENTLQHVNRWVGATFTPETRDNLLLDSMSPRDGRRPYQFGGQTPSQDMFLWYGGQNNVLIEITGNGCKRLADSKNIKVYGDSLNEIISTTHHRATRLDIAIDIETKLRPGDFVSQGYNPRIKTRVGYESATGETIYIGSKRADRYCRVYRYDTKTHAREGLLRIELVSKRKHAKMQSKFLRYYGVSHVAQMALNYFDFKSSYTPTIEALREKFPSIARETSMSKRRTWLEKQVIPAIQKMLINGEVTELELSEMLQVDIKQEILPF